MIQIGCMCFKNINKLIKQLEDCLTEFEKFQNTKFKKLELINRIADYDFTFLFEL